LPTQVLVAEDDTLLREGIASLLDRGGYEVVAAVEDADELRRRARGLKPELIVADIAMPPTLTDDGLQAAIELRGERPELRVMLVSQYVEATSLMKLLDTGAEGVGYLLKQRVSKLDEFLVALEQVLAGRSAIDPEVIAAMMGRAREDDPLAVLTDRQCEVLALMAQGRSNQAIATELVVSEETVQKHIGAIMSALDLPPSPDDHRRVLAVIKYLESAGGGARSAD
jgi:DNA-binding NarL/FixJ family response regulator